MKTILISKHLGSVTQLTSSWNGNQFSYLASSDTGTVKKHQLYYWNNQLLKTKMIVDTISFIFPATKSVSINRKPYFSENGNYLFFGVGIKPIIEPKDTLTEEEKYNLDIWSWTDNRLQPQQLKALNRDKKANSLFLFNITTQELTQLTDSSLNIRTKDKWHNNKYLLASSQAPYLKEMSWNGWYFDYYRLEVETGEKTLLKTHFNSRIQLSPSGKYAVYYSKIDSSWYSIDIKNNKETRITHKKVYHKKDFDTPGNPYAVGGVRWCKNEKEIIIHGQYDYWKITIDGTVEERITKGREKNISYSYWKTSDEKINYYNIDSINYFIGKNLKTKSEGIWKLNQGRMTLLANYNKKIYLLIKAKKADSILYSLMSFQEYPELQLSNLTLDKSITISSTNPQQENYNWGTAELVHWNSYSNNDSLTGLFYKPENFDSSKKYPMLVYFYEKNSQNLHRYYKP